MNNMAWGMKAYLFPFIIFIRAVVVVFLLFFIYVATIRVSRTYGPGKCEHKGTGADVNSIGLEHSYVRFKTHNVRQNSGAKGLKGEGTPEFQGFKSVVFDNFSYTGGLLEHFNTLERCSMEWNV